MEIGVFIPIGNNGWLISETAPQYMPTFELNKTVVLKAEQYGLDFVLSMIKLRGFGGKTEFWDHTLESFTLMAGLAAVTSRIKLFATAATLVMPPEKRMMSEVAKLLGTDTKRMGYLEPAAYERTVSELMSGGSDPVISRKPEGAWSHAVFEAASR